MATLQNLGVLKYRDKNGNWKPLPVVLQSSGGGGGGGISTISGKGQPTESTVGRLNQLYRDESTDKLYICTEVSDGGYTWAAVSGSGGTVDVDATLTKAGQAADAKAAGDAIGKKIDKNQGKENAGKLLGTDEQGLVRATYAGVDYPIVITRNGETYTSDKTFGEILEAYAGGAKIYALMYSKYHIPLLQADNGLCLFVGIIGENGEYCVITIDEYTTITYKMKYQVPIVTINTIGDYMNYNKPPTVMNLNDDSAPDGGGILYYAEGMSDVHIRYRLITRDGGLYEVTYDRRYQGITFRKILLPLPSPATAQVGQIVKVKAVDESGKITETETVDMPTVSGDYELVFQETVAEDVGSYSRDTDKDGNPFSLTDVMVIIFTRPFAESTNSGDRSLGFLPTSIWGRDIVSCYIGNAISSANPNSVGRYNVVFAKVVNGYQVVTRAYESQNSTNVFGVLKRQTVAGGEMFGFHTDATKLMQLNTPQGNMTCVKIVGYTKPLVSAGTIVALYKKKGT